MQNFGGFFIAAHSAAGPLCVLTSGPMSSEETGCFLRACVAIHAYEGPPLIAFGTLPDPRHNVDAAVCIDVGKREYNVFTGVFRNAVR